MASRELTSYRSVSLRPIGSHETCPLCTRPLPLHRPLCDGSPFVRYRTADLRSPSLRGSSPWSHASIVVSPRIRSYKCPTSRSFFDLPPQGKSDPAMDWTQITHTHDDKRPPSGGQQMQMQKPFLRLLDGTYRTMKDESDASFVLSLLYYLEPVHRKSTRVPLRTWQGRLRPGNPVQAAFPPALPPHLRTSGLSELLWF